MSKYTTEVRFICEQKAGLSESVGLTGVNDVLAKSWNKVFDSKFPIYDESYRSVLCQKILKHFYTREIGAETVGLWQLWLNERMELIMPYYNQLYKSALLEFNPLYDFEENTSSKRNITHNETVNDTTNTKTNFNSTSTKTMKNRFSDTPQGGLNGIESNTYLTNATLQDDSVNNGGTSNDTSTRNGGREYGNIDDYIESVKGKRGGQSYSKMLMEFRQSFLNIDNMIINELNDLFLNLW